MFWFLEMKEVKKVELDIIAILDTETESIFVSLIKSCAVNSSSQRKNVSFAIFSCTGKRNFCVLHQFLISLSLWKI